MKYDKAGAYELEYTATDECGNETTEVRNVLVARDIEAGKHIQLEQDGEKITINAECCTKAELLEILGYQEITISEIDDSGETLEVAVLGRVIE